MSKMLLNIDAMQHDFFDESAMIGIVTALPGYRLCWMINKHFDINFSRDPEQTIPFRKKGVEYFFPVYKYNLPNSSHQYLLYKLKHGAESLLPETKNLDYVWLLKTGNPEEDARTIITELKNIADIQLAQILTPAQLKSINNLLV